MKLNCWALIVLQTYFAYKDIVGHSSDWFMFYRHIEFRLVLLYL